MTLVYATQADLTTWMQPTALPANADQLLRSASLAVREATVTAFYATDNTGLPTDATTLQAFKDATCAQAAAYNAAGVNPLGGGVLTPGAVSERMIGSARINYADGQAAAAAREQLLTGLCVDAQRILHQAGVITNAVWTVG